MFLVVAAIKNSLCSLAWQSTSHGLRQAAPAEKVQVEEKGVWSTWTLSQVFKMLQLGQDMAPCETQATESHSGNKIRSKW